jgi:hypothetical protein
VKTHKSSIKFGKVAKLSPRFVVPFEVVEKKGPVGYRIAFPDSLRCVHDYFHVSILRHYVSDPTHVIDMSCLQVSYEGALMAEPISHYGPSHSKNTTSNSRSGQGTVGKLYSTLGYLGVRI